MTDKLLIYDLEICNAIPPKNDADRLPDIKYCQGWDDFQNMGISAISWCVLDRASLQTIESGVSGFTRRIIEEFRDRQLDPDIKIGGFNSWKFDDNLMQAHGLFLKSDFDILDLILLAAGVIGTSYWNEGKSYSLASIAHANGVEKTGAGENAPILYQKGRISELMMYCLNDSIVEADILRLLIKGQLIDPNTGSVLDLPGKLEILL
jgi:hypothetical protein